MTTAQTSVTRCSAPAGGSAPARSSAALRPGGPDVPRAAPRLRRLVAHLRSEVGAATAEYAIVIMAAVGFAGVLLAVMRSDEVRAVLSDLVRSALSVG
ncbi:DUF4244 domain-containing protein [Frigoribacterium sp. CFBP 8754]|uniref:DUF4244 domain-containing protein n=1 Tax=Frigoribacterium sp. CFBP 8754 TaxID=2775290 RepID=UPI0017845E2B|nr:DUF4244 domain-containing protein [Frigoribacterium sp. CFBP 8754]MBD8658931.1 DUF4244 domain-containing protein [Frigoribacterium sp. CFBP 8754]